MSKSLGNFFTIRDVLQKFDAETLRFFIVRAHYRSPLNYSDVHLDDARGALRRLYTALDLVRAGARSPIDWTEPHAARFKAAMDNDFATPEAVAVLFELAAEVNRTQVGRSSPACSRRWAAAWACCRATRKAFLRAGAALDEATIQRLIDAARRRQEGEGLRRGRPHPRGTAGPGHRAEGLADRHHLGGGVSERRAPRRRRSMPGHARLLGRGAASTWPARTG